MGSSDPPARDSELFRAVSRLPEELREVARLRLVERRTREDVAEELGLEPAEVGVRTEEAVEILSEDLDLDELTERLR